MTTIERWDTHEVALEAAQSYDNPFRDVEVTATFTHRRKRADHRRRMGFTMAAAPGAVRLLPLELGTWEYRTHSSDSGLDGQHGHAGVRRAAEGLPARARCKCKGFHFFHADGTPRFLISTRFSCQFADRAKWPALIALPQGAQASTACCS